MRRSMIEVYRLSGTKIHHPISDSDQLFLCRFRYLKIAISSRIKKCLLYSYRYSCTRSSSQLPDGKLQQSWRDNWKKYHVAHRQASQQESPDSAVYDLPIESPGALPEAVSRSEQREGWKKFHTRVGTTRSMRLHVCACCERGQFDTCMHSGLFTINTLERTVRGLPAPGMERQSPWDEMIDEHRKAAGSVGWTKDAWHGHPRGFW
eukprot:COSAG01_NODE_6135_length_3831_cov_1.886656_2_plen_206_part_00